jgi:hypothetical protein
MLVLKPFLATGTANPQGASGPPAAVERTRTRTARASWLRCSFGLLARSYPALSHSVTAQMLPLISQTLPRTCLTSPPAPAITGRRLNTSATRCLDSLAGLVVYCSAQRLHSAHLLPRPPAWCLSATGFIGVFQWSVRQLHSSA